jgi:SHS2 domain-containing protein
MNDRGSATRAHTADVIVDAWGSDLASCIEEAVVAVIGLCVEPSDDLDEAGEWSAPVAITGGSDEALLMATLDEVIFTIDTSHAVPVGATVVDHDGALELTFQLADRDLVEPTGAVPKAISRSELAIATSADQVRCSFLVDV